MNRFVIAEPDKCIGCRTCEVACVLAHPKPTGEAPALSPQNFLPRLRLVKSENLTAPVQCRHCENAPCVASCPTGALHYEDNTVQLATEQCIGCQTCVIVCPFGAIEMVSIPVAQPGRGGKTMTAMMSVAHKCDMCPGVEGGPACIRVCPTKALHLIDSEALDTQVNDKREKTLRAMPDNR